METKNKSPDLKKLRRRIEELEQQRAPWMSTWEDITKYICPGRGLYNAGTEPNQGDRRDKELLDSTPLGSLTTLAAGMQGGLTSPSRPWFRLGVADPTLRDYGPVRLWLDEVERRMRHIMGRSNIYNSLHTLYEEMGAFGIGCMLLEEDSQSVIRARTMTVGEYCLGIGADLRVDTFCRKFWMTAWQLLSEFGDSVPRQIKESVERTPDAWHQVSHVISPNDDRLIGRTDNKNMPFISVYWIDGKEDDGALRVSGYNEFPVMAPRWNVLSGDTYGRGPGWSALGESKTLQEMRKDMLIVNKLAIRPPVWGSTEAKNARIDLTPGGITYATGDVGLRPVYQVQPDTPGQLQAMADARAQIKTIFFSDLFLMLQGISREMTAREVAERHEEKMLMLGPVLERLDNELLDPTVARTFGVMDRMGLIPPPPEELAGQDLQIEYISTLAQAQQAVGLGGIDRLVAFVGGVAPIAPEVLDKIDIQETVDQYARMLGTPASVVRSDEDVAILQQQRQQQQMKQQQMMEMQQAAQMAQTGAGAAKELAQTPVASEDGQQGSALDALLSELGGGGM